MRVCQSAVLATALALALVHTRPAAAECASVACPRQPAVDTVRSLVAAACDCTAASNHHQYVRCAKEVIRGAIKLGNLPAACRNTVRRCEVRTTCGISNATICCNQTPRGSVKALLTRHEAKCQQTPCTGASSLADACTAQGTCAPVKHGVKAFRTVQQVFQQSCALASCHSAFSRQGELVLDSEDISFVSLVNRAASHPDAVSQGLLRVKPGDPENSFLIRKLGSPGPGDAMPQSGGQLSEPIIKMIEDWIRRGARTTAEECPHQPGQPSACDDAPIDTGDYHWQPLAPLEPPAASEGIQLYVPQRPVVAGTEWEMCYAFRVPWDQVGATLNLGGSVPVIKQQTYRMHPGSHHLLVYMYFGQHPEVWPEGYFPCNAANCINQADCPPDSGEFTIPIGGTQVAGTRYEVDYPKGVGIPILGNTAVIIANPHYTNPFQPQQPIYGEAWLNLYFYHPGEFKAVLDGIFAVNFRDLIVEPYQTRTISSVWQPRNILTRQPTDAALFQLFGHMHKRGTEFQIDYVHGGACSVSGAACGRDQDCACKPWQKTCTPGQTCQRGPGAEDTTIYYTTAWDQAPIMGFDKPYLLVSRSDGLRWTCTHRNGDPNDPNYPPKTCDEGCAACGWDAASRTCIFKRGVDLGVDAAPRVFNQGDPMPLVFGLLAGDDMCNMFGYFIEQADLPKLE